MSSPAEHDMAKLLEQIERHEKEREYYVQRLDEQSIAIEELRKQMEWCQQFIKAKNDVIHDRDVHIQELTELCNKLTDRCDRAMRAGFLEISSSSGSSDDDSNDGEAASSNEHA